MGKMEAKEAQERRDKLKVLLDEAGYKSFRAFSRDLGITCANLYTNIDGTYKISIDRIFKIANLLGKPVLQIIEIFYPKELAENYELSR